MRLLLAPIEPPDGELCWSVRFVHDKPVREVLVESVDYEWGDQGNERKLGHRFGPLAPGVEVEIYRETDTEVRTSLTLSVDGLRWYAELGKLYRDRPPRTITPQRL